MEAEIISDEHDLVSLKLLRIVSKTLSGTWYKYLVHYLLGFFFSGLKSSLIIFAQNWVFLHTQICFVNSETKSKICAQK